MPGMVLYYPHIEKKAELSSHFTMAWWKILKFLLIIFLSFFPILWERATFSQTESKNSGNPVLDLKDLAPFQAGETLETIEKKFGKGILIKKKDLFQIYKFYIPKGYSLSRTMVLVQIFQEKTLDFYAVFPSSFLHDVFHRTFLADFGKQDEYYKMEKEAIYIWKSKNNIQYVYEAGCAITCFPIFLTGIPENAKQSSPQFVSILEDISKGVYSPFE